VACRLVVHFELPWTPGRLQQRCGRVYRIGQNRRVHEIALIADDTAEARVLLPLATRAWRARGFAHGPLLQRLTESRIAGHVIAGDPLHLGEGPPPALPACLGVMSLKEEGQAEAARLEMLRRLANRPPRGRPPAQRAVSLAVACLKRARAGPHYVHMVLALGLRDGQGPLLERTVMAVSLPAQAGWPRRPAQLRAEVARAIAGAAPALNAAADALLSARRRALAPLLGRRIAALAARDADMQRTLPSAARQLVQPGLFDRRAVRAAAARVHAVALRRDDEQGRCWWRGAETRAAADGFEIRAVLIGGRL
jgi:hypothetical protein